MGTTAPSRPLTLRREIAATHDNGTPVVAWIVRRDGHAVGVFGSWDHAMQLVNATQRHLKSRKERPHD